MKLSEAIRLGAMLRPQAFGSIHGIQRGVSLGGVLGLSMPDIVTTCALGAAMEAFGCKAIPAEEATGEVLGTRGRPVKGEMTIQSPDEWARFLIGTYSCPACDTFRGHGTQIIPHLNDTHRWTRERIASFVEQIENQQTVSALTGEQHA